MTFEWLNSDSISEADVSDINTLLHQLTASPRILDLETAREVADSSLWRAVRDDQGRIKGIATLVVIHIPTGKVTYVHDVVVDGSLRGTGAGETLMKRLVAQAQSIESVNRIELTCKPDRVPANKLYQKVGFVLRETNSYIIKF